MYLLDTNIISHLLRKRPNPRLVERLKREPPDVLFTSCICIMELRNGTARLDDHGLLWRRIEQDILRELEILPIQTQDALRAGDLLAYLHARGKPIDVEDVLIGATALQNGLTVVTNNVKHFGRIPNLRVEDWLV